MPDEPAPSPEPGPSPSFDPEFVGSGEPPTPEPPTPEPPPPVPTRPCPRCEHETPLDLPLCPVCRAPLPWHQGVPGGSGGARPDLRPLVKPLFGIYLLLLLTNVVLSWVLRDLPDVTPLPEPEVARAATTLTVAESVDAVLVLIALLSIARWIPTPTADPARRRRAWLLAPVALLLILAVNLGYHWALRTMAGVEPETDAMMGSGHHTYWLLALICVQPAIVEELFFRRLAFDFFCVHTTVGSAAFASAAMFAAAHTGAFLSFPPLLVFGLVAAWLRRTSGSLALPMLLHFLHNLVISLYDLLPA